MPENLTRALKLLPERLRAAAERAQATDRGEIEEIRLRAGQAPTLLQGGKEWPFDRERVLQQHELRMVLERASGASLHTVSKELQQGYLTTSGGIRIGVCGYAGGLAEGMRDLSSLVIRIPRQIKGVGGALPDRLSGESGSVLVLSPPGGGKTTFLRELIRCCSCRGYRVGVADERDELAGMVQGVPQFDLGPCTDVIRGLPKAEGMMLLMRAMTPEILAVDEVTEEKDGEAMVQAGYCGVRLLATAHARDTEDLSKRALYRRVLDSGVFTRAVVIRRVGGERRYEEETL